MSGIDTSSFKSRFYTVLLFLPNMMRKYITHREFPLSNLGQNTDNNDCFRGFPRLLVAGVGKFHCIWRGPCPCTPL